MLRKYKGNQPRGSPEAAAGVRLSKLCLSFMQADCAVHHMQAICTPSVLCTKGQRCYANTAIHPDNMAQHVDVRESSSWKRERDYNAFFSGVRIR